MKRQKLYLTTFILFALSLLGLESTAGDIVEYDQPFVVADKIKKEKIEPLQLSVGSIGQAMRKLEEIGYTCGIPYPKQGWGRYGGILCEQYTSNQYCEVSLVILYILDWDEKLSDEERLSLVDTKAFQDIVPFSVLCRGGKFEPLQTIEKPNSVNRPLPKQKMSL